MRFSYATYRPPSDRLAREIEGIDEAVEPIDTDPTPPHGIPRIPQDGPVIDGFFDRERGDE